MPEDVDRTDEAQAEWQRQQDEKREDREDPELSDSYLRYLHDQTFAEDPRR
jgi:hypothetical protein